MILILQITGLDEEKRKYFKIMPDHVVPEGAKYSRAGVKREKEEKDVSLVH